MSVRRGGNGDGDAKVCLGMLWMDIAGATSTSSASSTRSGIPRCYGMSMKTSKPPRKHASSTASTSSSSLSSSSSSVVAERMGPELHQSGFTFMCQGMCKYVPGVHPSDANIFPECSGLEIIVQAIPPNAHQRHPHAPHPNPHQHRHRRGHDVHHHPGKENENENDSESGRGHREQSSPEKSPRDAALDGRGENVFLRNFLRSSQRIAHKMGENAGLVATAAKEATEEAVKEIKKRFDATSTKK
mmetsp:Transcript_7442/g.19117  ORF Transcript_7442/g.19117 Transcript_7442/m.19117 type:complete len:244 (+) Transcript_7442:369-1100(+)